MAVVLRRHGGDGGATAVLVRCHGGHGGAAAIPLRIRTKEGLDMFKVFAVKPRWSTVLSFSRCYGDQWRNQASNLTAAPRQFAAMPCRLAAMPCEWNSRLRPVWPCLDSLTSRVYLTSCLFRWWNDALSHRLAEHAGRNTIKLSLSLTSSPNRQIKHFIHDSFSDTTTRVAILSKPGSNLQTNMAIFNDNVFIMLHFPLSNIKRCVRWPHLVLPQNKHWSNIPGLNWLHLDYQRPWDHWTFWIGNDMSTKLSGSLHGNENN